MARGNRKLADIGKAVDSAANNDFLGLDDSGGIFKDVAYSTILSKPTILDSSALTSLVDAAYVQARQTDVGIDSAAIINLVDSSYVGARKPAAGLDSSQTTNLIDSSYVSGKVSAGLDSSQIINFVDSDYIASKAGASSGFSYYKYTATAGQKEFTGADLDNNTLSYTENGILVFYNGVLLLPTFDFTATDGSTVTLADSADSGATIAIGEWALSSAGGGAAANSGDRAIIFNASSGTSANYGNKIEYFDITTTGNASSFGTLVGGRSSQGSGGPGAAISSGTNCIFADNRSPFTGQYELEFVVAATTGNASEFGSLASTAHSGKSGVSDGSKGYYTGSNQVSVEVETVTITTQSDAVLDSYTSVRKQDGGSWASMTEARGVWGGGNSATTYANEIFYMELPIAANSSDFGDLTVGRNYPAAGGDETYAVWGGGWTGSQSNVIDYVTIASTGNASDFGDLTVARYAACSTNGTRACWIGGYNGSTRTNTIDYVTIQTTGNASDFGDMTDGGNQARGTSGTP